MAAAILRGKRLEIALAARGDQEEGDRKRTLYELSKALGSKPGDIQRSVRQMLDDHVLRADGPPGRGTLYWFNEEEFGEALDESLASDHLPGRLVKGQRALAIEAPEGTNRFAVLARGSLNGSVSWVAEWGSGNELLVGLEPETTLLEAERLVTAFQERGFKCQHRTVGEVLSADQVRRVTKSFETVVKGAGP